MKNSLEKQIKEGEFHIKLTRDYDRSMVKKLKLCGIWGMNCAVENINCGALGSLVRNKKRFSMSLENVIFYSVNDNIFAKSLN